MPLAAESEPERFDLIVIGTGFGGAMTALSLTHQLEAMYGGTTPPPQRPPRILMIERGTWWTTPVETVQDKEVTTRKLLLKKQQPFQEWSTANDLRGTLDLVERCRRTPERRQGLYEFTTIGKRGFLGRQNDGVAVLSASGVGGGSLVYSNITIRPPETLFQDPRWPGTWGAADRTERDRLYSLARNAIGYSVQYALEKAAKPSVEPPAAMKVNTGLSKIVSRSAGLKPSWNQNFQIVTPSTPPAVAPHPAELIDRARVFQTSVAQLAPDQWGTVDLAINDLVPEGENRTEPHGRNYCERQGRCNIGCLPGARHTLNKQIMRALYGQFASGQPITEPTDPNPNPKPLLQHVRLELWTLTDVDYITALPGGGYRLSYRRATARHPQDETAGTIDTDRLIVAAGCLGTAEIMLRSQERAKATDGKEGLPGLSARVGQGFSTNGDYIAFLTPTRQHVNLTRGPVTTSFAEFNANAPRAENFHNIEDQGIPRTLAGLTGYGVPLMQSLAHGHSWLLSGGTFRQIVDLIRGLLTLHPPRHTPPEGPEDQSGNRPEAGDELTAMMMCVVAQGKEAAVGQFWLEGGRLRVRRTDGRAFHQDPIYTTIQATLGRLAAVLRAPNSQAAFQSPFEAGGRSPIAGTSHPLGGCPMGADINTGVVDEWGRVFRDPRAGTPRFYPGLYIADASVIPTALGVNPSLTISAVALRIAEGVVREITQPAKTGSRSGRAPAFS